MKIWHLFPACALLAGCASLAPARADTLAYWRFENGAPGTFTDVGPIANSDSAGQNTLSVAARETRPLYSGDVPLPRVPQTGQPNRVAVDLHFSEDFFTPDVPLDVYDFGPGGSNAWTVEMSVKMSSVNGVSRLAGRDGVTPGVDTRGPLQILVNGADGKFDVRAEILDGSNAFRDAVSQPIYRPGQWLNIAATADATTLKLYVDALDGRGYQLVGQKAIEGALNKTTGVFSVGRGFAGNPSDNIGGLIDEVRVSNVALAPAQFLFSNPNGAPVKALSAPPLVAPRPLQIFSGADPDVAFYNGKFWMYITAQNNIGPKNPVFYAFSSPDLKTWTKSAQPIFQFKNAPWIAANKRDYNGAWAPTIFQKNGKYYLYYSVGPQNAQGPARLGVAVANAPDGTFVDSGKALFTGGKGFEAIDPMVFEDPKTGTDYLYAGGSAGAKLRVWELAPDLVSLKREIPVETPPNFTEGVFMHFENGQYYLSYSHGYWAGASYSVYYATAPTPTGPWQYRGPILQSDLTRKGPGHHSFVQDPRSGQWYIVYHRWQSPDGGNPFKAKGGRSIGIEPIYYDATGAILPIEMTDQNIPILAPISTIRMPIGLRPFATTPILRAPIAPTKIAQN